MDNIWKNNVSWWVYHLGEIKNQELDYPIVIYTWNKVNEIISDTDLTFIFWLSDKVGDEYFYWDFCKSVNKLSDLDRIKVLEYTISKWNFPLALSLQKDFSIDTSAIDQKKFIKGFMNQKSLNKWVNILLVIDFFQLSENITEIYNYLAENWFIILCYFLFKNNERLWKLSEKQMDLMFKNATWVLAFNDQVLDLSFIISKLSTRYEHDMIRFYTIFWLNNVDKENSDEFIIQNGYNKPKYREFLMEYLENKINFTENYYKKSNFKFTWNIIFKEKENNDILIKKFQSKLFKFSVVDSKSLPLMTIFNSWLNNPRKYFIYQKNQSFSHKQTSENIEIYSDLSEYIEAINDYKLDCMESLNEKNIPFWITFLQKNSTGKSPENLNSDENNNVSAIAA